MFLSKKYNDYDSFDVSPQPEVVPIILYILGACLGHLNKPLRSLNSSEKVFLEIFTLANNLATCGSNFLFNFDHDIAKLFWPTRYELEEKLQTRWV